jgi:hypothetical protein
MFKDIFKNVFVITIERNIKRRAYIEHVLKGVDFLFYYGLDLTMNYLDCQYVHNIPDEVFAEYDLDKEYCSAWSKGQFGAFATEKKVIKDFALLNKNENLVVLLDDIVFEPNWQEHLIKGYKELPADWDVFILSTRFGKEKKRLLRFIFRLKRRVDIYFKNKTITTVKKYSRYLDICPGNVNGVFGVIYSPKGLNKLLNEPNRLRKEQDDVLLSKLINEKYLKAFIAYPMIAREGEYDGSWTQKNEF